MTKKKTILRKFQLDLLLLPKMGLLFVLFSRKKTQNRGTFPALKTENATVGSLEVSCIRKKYPNTSAVQDVWGSSLFQSKNAQQEMQEKYQFLLFLKLQKRALPT